jgi:eukaryotic-like serine/threonine-protein kinase
MSGFQLSDWDDVGDLVERALGEPAAGREALLREACGDDPTRLARARSVLAAAERADAFLDRSVGELAPDLVAARQAIAAAEPLTHVGPYRLLERIGRGGMGDVYLAERADDEFERRVAVKVVKAGLGADLVARFLSERQLLASFDDPHIARLHDGGVAPDGRPYLVMEYVDGQPLDTYADAHALTIDQRLELFLQVCDAVDRAHRRLVVHRDLKPANILITSDGTAKLLDFGVAKLLDPGTIALDAPVTRGGMRILTPEYGSPEQFLGEPTSTAADVYALGVILYELLCGRRPHEDGEPELAALERRVLEGTMSAPSAACRLATARSTGPDRARARGLTLDALSRRLRGDLDNIALTALRREPDRRYASVAALREDLQRHRAGRPVSARPLTARYRTGKFVRRHRVGVAAAALVTVAVVTGTTGTLLQARAAAREGQRAAQMRDFLVGVFEISDPDRSRGETITARDLLDRGSDRIRRELASDPELRADMLSILGRLYGQLGAPGRARTHLEEAVALRRSTGAPPRQLIDTLTSLASARHAEGANDDAERLLREALVLARSSGGDLRDVEAGVLSDLAAVDRARGRFDVSESHAREALAIRRALGAHGGLADTLNGLGVLLGDAGRHVDAVAVLEEGLTFGRRAYGPEHTKVVLGECNLAQARHRAGQLDAALAGFRACVAARRRLLGNGHPDVAFSLNNMAQVHSDRNEHDDAERLYVEALAINRATYGERHREVAATLNNLAIIAFQRTRYDEAAARFRELTGVWRSLLGPTHPNVLTSLNNLGMSLQRAGHLAEAEQHLGDVLEGRRAVLGAEHPDVAMSMVNLSQVLRLRSSFVRARALTSQALSILEKKYPGDHPMVGLTLAELGRIHLGLGSPAEAMAYFDRAVAMGTKVYGAAHLQTASARLGRGEALAAMGKMVEARTVIRGVIDDLAAGKHGGSRTAKDAAAALAALRP